MTILINHKLKPLVQGQIHCSTIGDIFRFINIITKNLLDCYCNLKNIAIIGIRYCKKKLCNNISSKYCRCSRKIFLVSSK